MSAYINYGIYDHWDPDDHPSTRPTMRANITSSDILAGTVVQVDLSDLGTATIGAGYTPNSGAGETVIVDGARPDSSNMYNYGLYEVVAQRDSSTSGTETVTVTASDLSGSSVKEQIQEPSL